MDDGSEPNSPLSTGPDPSHQYPLNWSPSSPISQALFGMQAAPSGLESQQGMGLPVPPGSATAPAIPAVATAATTFAVAQLAVPAPQSVAVTPQQLTAPAAQTVATPSDPPIAGVPATVTTAITPTGAAAAPAQPPATASAQPVTPPPPPAVATTTAGLVPVLSTLPQLQLVLPTGLVAPGFIVLVPLQPQQQGHSLPGIAAVNAAAATAQPAAAQVPPSQGHPATGAVEVPPQLLALLQLQIAGNHVDPAALAAAAGSSYVPAPAGAAAAAAAAPYAAQNQTPPTAAGFGAQGSSAAQWTLERSREQDEQDMLRPRQQYIRRSGRTKDTRTSPAAAAAAAAPAAPGRAKKRRNARRNMRKACRQAEQASVPSSGAAAAGEGSSDQHASGGKAGRKRGRPSLIHRRTDLLRKLKALLGWRGWLLWNTLVAVVGDGAGNLNDAGVNAFFHSFFGPSGYRWPQDVELTHQGIDRDLYIARLLSSLIGSFIHPSEVAGFFKQKRKGKTEVNQDYLASNGLHPDEWTWPLQEGPLAQPGPQQMADQQQSAEDIHAVEDAAVAALQEYNAEAAALLEAGLQRLRDDEAISNRVLKPTGTKRRQTLEKNIIAAAQQRGNPAASAAAAVAEPQASMGADAASQQLPAAAAPTSPTTARRRRTRRGGVNQGGAEAATNPAGAAAAAETAAEDAQPGQTVVTVPGTAPEQDGSDEMEEEAGEGAPAGRRRSKRRKVAPRR